MAGCFGSKKGKENRSVVGFGNARSPIFYRDSDSVSFSGYTNPDPPVSPIGKRLICIDGICNQIKYYLAELYGIAN